MSSVSRWLHREPGTSGVGSALCSNIGVGALSFALGVLRFGYRDLGSDHPFALLLPAGATAAGSAVVGLVLVSRPPLRRFGAGVLGGVLFALATESGLLAIYLGQIIAE